MDLKKKSALLEEAYKVVNSKKTTELFRKNLLEKTIAALFETNELNAPLDKLDEKFYDIEDEEIEELLSIYIKNH